MDDLDLMDDNLIDDDEARDTESVKESSYTDDDIMFQKSEDEKKKKICQFEIDGNDFFPTVQTTETLPAGLYKIRRDYNKGVFLRKTNIVLGRLIKLNTCPIFDEILKDISLFWKSKESYEKRGRIFKRNILLYSNPGMGKTSLINLLMDDLIKNHDGLILSLSADSDIANFSEIMTYIRNSMPYKPIIAIIEDIDNFVGEKANRDTESELLSILDGVNTFDNIVIIATTNYPENLTQRFINRPSRFNKVIEYQLLNEDSRREFITKINLPEDLEKINIETWVKKTVGYTTDMLKELSDSVFINGTSEAKAFRTIDKMKDGYTIKCSKSGNSMGF
jgi:hypothetical protein